MLVSIVKAIPVFVVINRLLALMLLLCRWNIYNKTRSHQFWSLRDIFNFTLIVNCLGYLQFNLLILCLKSVQLFYSSFDEFCRIRCLFTMSYVTMTFRQISFVAVNYGQDEFCRQSSKLMIHQYNTRSWYSYNYV